MRGTCSWTGWPESANMAGIVRWVSELGSGVSLELKVAALRPPLLLCLLESERRCVRTVRPSLARKSLRLHAASGLCVGHQLACIVVPLWLRRELLQQLSISSGAPFLLVH